VEQRLTDFEQNGSYSHTLRKWYVQDKLVVVEVHKVSLCKHTHAQDGRVNTTDLVIYARIDVLFCTLSLVPTLDYFFGIFRYY